MKTTKIRAEAEKDEVIRKQQKVLQVEKDEALWKSKMSCRGRERRSSMERVKWPAEVEKDEALWKE